MFRSRPITDHELSKDDILELYYITPITNLEPILRVTDEEKRGLNTNLPDSSPEPSDHEEEDSKSGDEGAEKSSKRLKKS